MISDLIIAGAGIAFGAIIGFLFSWLSSIIILNRQESDRAKREIRETIIKLIVKIKYDMLSPQWKLWKNLADHSPVLEETIKFAISYLDKTTGEAVLEAYNNYKCPDITSKMSSFVEIPLKIYSVDEHIAEAIPDFPYKDGREFAIHNLESILILVK
jgi:hypothetical protein